MDGVLERVDPVGRERIVASRRSGATKALGVNKLTIVESSITDVVVDPQLRISRRQRQALNGRLRLPSEGQNERRRY